jgi:hypothetical protein
MNAQLNSTNFQQFVASNKGKKITFKHVDALGSTTGTEISKVVVDVCGDYFTCKNQESDVKIDGFYYFSDCQPVNNSLIDVLQKHKVVVIKCFHVDYIFRYSHTTDNVIYGVNLNTTNNLSFSIEGSIKEVWSIVDCKYSQVWKEEKPKAEEEQPVVPKEQPVVPKEQPIVPNKINDYETTIENILSKNKNVTVYTREKVYWNFNLSIKYYSSFTGISNGCPVSIHFSTITSIYSKEGTVLFSKSENIQKDSESFKKEKRRFEAFKAMGKEWIILTENFNTDVSDKFGKVIKRMMVEEYSPELYNEFCSSYESLRVEVSKNMKQFKSLPQTQAISKRFSELTNACKKVCDDEPIDDLVEKINKLMTVEGKNRYSALFEKRVKIEYRGKPKTVEIINEYTHANGKEYILVKDITDHDKTKTLFKEYVKYM